MISTVCSVCSKTISQHEGDFPCKPPQLNVKDYKCRNNFVLIKIVKLDEQRGLVMPDTSIHGKEFHVMAKGPKVDNLQEGDKVLIVSRVEGDGSQVQNYYPLPNDKDYFVVDEKYLALVLWSKTKKEE